MPQALSRLEYFGSRISAQGFSGIGRSPSAALTLPVLDADGDEAPQPVDQVLVARVDLGQLFQQRRIEVLPVGKLGAVQGLEKAGLDLRLREMCTGHDDVVAGLAGDQLGMQDLVVVVVVIDHLDAGFLLEILERVLGNVVRPVVDVQHLRLGLGRRRRWPAQTPPCTPFPAMPPAHAAEDSISP